MYRDTIQQIYSVALLSVLLVSGFSITPQHVQAQESVIVVGGNGTLAQTMTAAATDIVASAQESLLIKEFTLDDIAFSLAKLALQQITKSTIRWINSGFEGNPAFVTDLNGFLRQSADEIAGEIIYGSALQTICEPFQLDVQLALDLSSKTIEDEVQCTFSDAVGNVDAFLNGDFLEGGLAGWFDVTVKPNNNFFSAYANSKVALNGEVNQQLNEMLTQLGWADGFFSKKECIVSDGEEECSVTLPGKAISDTLQFQLSTGPRTLIEADEINEVIGALFSQLAVQGLQGAGGLLGLTRTGGQYGNTSYIDRVGNPQFEPAPPENAIGEYDFIGDALTDERAYQNLYSGVVAQADGILTRIETDASCKNVTSIQSQTTVIRNDAETTAGNSAANLLTLENLNTRYRVAKESAHFSESANEELNLVLNKFISLKESGQLHSSITIARDRRDVDDIRARLSGFENQLDDRCDDEETEKTNRGSR